MLNRRKLTQPDKHLYSPILYSQKKKWFRYFHHLHRCVFGNTLNESSRFCICLFLLSVLHDLLNRRSALELSENYQKPIHSKNCSECSNDLGWSHLLLQWCCQASEAIMNFLYHSYRQIHHRNFGYRTTHIDHLNTIFHKCTRLHSKFHHSHIPFSCTVDHNWTTWQGILQLWRLFCSLGWHKIIHKKRPTRWLVFRIRSIVFS